MAELEHCPFCRGKNIVVCTTEDLGRDKFEFGYFAVCDATNGGCGAATGWQKTKEKAIEAWNRRADDEHID